MSKRAVALSLLFWFVLLAFGVGLWFWLDPATRAIESMRIVGGLMLIVSSLALLWESRNEEQDKARSRVSKLALLAYGIGTLVPDVTARAILTCIPVVVLSAAMLRFPRRLFPAPPAP